MACGDCQLSDAHRCLRGGRKPVLPAWAPKTSIPEGPSAATGSGVFLCIAWCSFVPVPGQIMPPPCCRCCSLIVCSPTERSAPLSLHQCPVKEDFNFFISYLGVNEFGTRRGAQSCQYEAGNIPSIDEQHSPAEPRGWQVQFPLGPCSHVHLSRLCSSKY